MQNEKRIIKEIDRFRNLRAYAENHRIWYKFDQCTEIISDLTTTLEKVVFGNIREKMWHKNKDKVW